jgi:hypothetical protein
MIVGLNLYCLNRNQNIKSEIDLILGMMNKTDLEECSYLLKLDEKNVVILFSWDATNGPYPNGLTKLNIKRKAYGIDLWCGNCVPLHGAKSKHYVVKTTNTVGDLKKMDPIMYLKLLSKPSVFETGTISQQLQVQELERLLPLLRCHSKSGVKKKGG